jgi:hypothetical protein
VVSFTFRPLYNPGKSAVPTEQEAGVVEQKKNLLFLSGMELRIVQPVANPYTDYTVPCPHMRMHVM